MSFGLCVTGLRHGQPSRVALLSLQLQSVVPQVSEHNHLRLPLREQIARDACTIASIAFSLSGRPVLSHGTKSLSLMPKLFKL
jgi:hypothetical protein